MIDFVNSNGSMTVNTNPAYTQYLQFTDLNGQSSDAGRGTLTPILTADDTEDLTQQYTSNKLQALFRFLEKLIKLIFKLFTKGE